MQFISDFNSSSGGTDRLDLQLDGTSQAVFGGNNSAQKMSILAGGQVINSTHSVYDLSLVIIQIDYKNNTTKMWVKPTLSSFDYKNPDTPDAVYNSSIDFNGIELVFRSGGQIDEISIFKLYNSAPTNISLSSSSLNENVATGTTIGALSTTDSDSGDTHTYSLVSGTGDTDKRR